MGEIERLYDARGEAFRELAGIDRDLFAQLADALVAAGVAFDPEALERERIGRERRRLLDTIPSMGFAAYDVTQVSQRVQNVRRTAEADLVRIVGELDAPGAEPLVLVHDVLLAWEAETRGRTRAIVEAWRRAERAAAAHFVGALDHDEEHGWHTGELEADAALAAAVGAWADAFEDLAERTERWKERVAAALAAGAPEAHALFERAWDEAIFPAIFRDGGAVFDALDRAFALDDLDERTREGLAELAMTYRADWERITLAMVERREEDPNDWQGFGRLAGDRREVNAGARRRLAELLGPDRAARVGLESPR